MKGDPRDPRADAKTWPCMGRHVPGPPAANNHGQWQRCARCDFRMSYIPRQGSKGQFTATKNPEMMARALRELRPLMGDFAPTATIVRAMQAKVGEEEVLRNHIRDLRGRATRSCRVTPTSWRRRSLLPQELPRAPRRPPRPAAGKWPQHRT